MQHCTKVVVGIVIYMRNLTGHDQILQGYNKINLRFVLTHTHFDAHLSLNQVLRFSCLGQCEAVGSSCNAKMCAYEASIEVCI